jgi:hypothetical protein
MKLRTMAVLGGLGVAAIALIGAGASATFTANTTSTQSISAGTLSLVLTANNVASGYDTPSITFAPLTNVPSTFISPAELITITNNGSVTANEINLQVTDTAGNPAGANLASEMSMCIYSDGSILFNGTLKADESLGNMAVGGTIAPSGTDTYTAVFYAGNEATGCGNVSGYQYGTSDDNANLGLGGPGPLTTYPLPSNAPAAGTPTAGTSNAGTLNGDSEGGADSVTVTVSYSG